MPTRKLNEQELATTNSLLEDVRRSIEKLSGDDPDLRFAIRRKIAKELGVSIKTIETHREHIKQKLQLKNATELIYTAVFWLQNQNR